jgi:hypothetical protein
MNLLPLALVAVLAAAAPASAPVLVTEDLDRFWAVWDATGGAPDAAALQKGYLDPGTQGLKDFLRLRIQSAEQLAKHIKAFPAYYAGLRRTTAGSAARSSPRWRGCARSTPRASCRRCTS